VNGEAIYGTRPWLVYGEGPTMVDCSCGRKGTDTESFAPQDIRYTMRGRNLYAIALGKPESGNLLLRSLMKDSPYLHGPVTSVTLLGSSQLVEWQQGADGLILNFPAGAPDEPAYAFRIQTRFSSAP
jgi:alpha-L-fucosidase